MDIALYGNSLNSMMVVSALLATFALTAIITPPGGVSSFCSADPGQAQILTCPDASTKSHNRLVAFLWSNSSTFTLAMCTLLLLIALHGQDDKQMLAPIWQNAYTMTTLCFFLSLISGFLTYVFALRVIYIADSPFVQGIIYVHSVIFGLAIVVAFFVQFKCTESRGVSVPPERIPPAPQGAPPIPSVMPDVVASQPERIPPTPRIVTDGGAPPIPSVMPRVVASPLSASTVAETV